MSPEPPEAWPRIPSGRTGAARGHQGAGGMPCCCHWLLRFLLNPHKLGASPPYSPAPPRGGGAVLSPTRTPGGVLHPRPAPLLKVMNLSRITLSRLLVNADDLT